MPEKSSLTLSCSSLLAQKSPKLIGLPRPYTPKLYSSGSYMANRPSFMGSYRRPEIMSSDSSKPTTFSVYTKLPGLRNDPIDLEPLSLQSSNKSPSFNSVSDSICNNIDAGKKELEKKGEKEDEKCAYTKANCVNSYVNSSGETEVSLDLFKCVYILTFFY